MAIQTINLTVPGGDTPRSANTKINANFSDQTNAASRIVGKAAGNIPEMEATGGVAGTGIGGKGPRGHKDFISSDPAERDKELFTGLVTDGKGSRVFHMTDLADFATGYNTCVFLQGINSFTAISGSHTGNIVNIYAGYGSNETLILKKHRLWTSLNATKDANGFLKASSPIVKVFADKVELNGEAEDQNVSYKKNGVGDYTITTVSGISTDGWYIELPKDMNGNPKVAVTLSEVEGVITLKSYKRIFSMETFTFEPDLDNPLDIPDTRWIDLRLNEIPAEEVNP